MDSAAIVARRKALGLSQRALARDLGVHNSTVSRWERAQCSPRGRNRAKLIAKLSVEQPRMTIMPCSLREANAYVQKWHRHHGPVVGAKFAVAVRDATEVRGVAIVGRPVARHLDDGTTLEVTRVATDGTPNACSSLYGAAWRAARALGYQRLITYKLKTEPGISLRAANFRRTATVTGRSWSCSSRPRGLHLIADKERWEISLGHADKSTPQAADAGRLLGATDSAGGGAGCLAGAK